MLSAENEGEIRELEADAQERLLRALPEKLYGTSDSGVEHAWKKMGSHTIGSLLTATLEHWARLGGGNLPARNPRNPHVLSCALTCWMAATAVYAQQNQLK